MEEEEGRAVEPPSSPEGEEALAATVAQVLGLFRAEPLLRRYCPGVWEEPLLTCEDVDGKENSGGMEKLSWSRKLCGVCLCHTLKLNILVVFYE